MAGMFYTLAEAMDKLGKTEEQIKVFVREGKLREFRDGPAQLYKIEDVDALAAEPSGDTSVLDDSLELSIDESGDISLAPEELAALSPQDTDKPVSGDAPMSLDETGSLSGDDTLSRLSSDDTDSRQDSDTADVSDADTVANVSNATDDDIVLESADSGIVNAAGEDTVVPDDMNGDDTKLASAGGDTINVLGDTDSEYDITEDTSGETKLFEEPSKALDEQGLGEESLSVERLDDDINLDSFGGSGSGLLDLSLQADDTSLGAVLDDIYPEGDAAVANAAEQSPSLAGGGVAAEAEKIFEETEPLSVPAGAEMAPIGAAGMYVEPEPDAASNAFGITLFVPLIAIIYAAIVIISAYKPIAKLNIVSGLEDIIWYIAGGAAAVVVIIVLIGSFMTSGGTNKVKTKKVSAKKTKKAKKPKKAKNQKKQKTAEYKD